MGLTYLLLYGCIIAVFILILSKICAGILSKVLSQILKKEVSIDYIGFFSLKNVSIQLHKSSVVLDDIWISWRLFNPSQNYRMALHLGDVRVRAEMQNDSQGTARHERGEEAAKPGSSLLDSSYFTSAVRFITKTMCLNVEALNIMLLNAMGTDSLLHVTIKNISLAGAPLTEQIISTDLEVQEISLRMLRSANSDAGEQSHMAHASTSLKVSAQLDFIMKKILGISVNVGTPRVSLQDGFMTQILQTFPKTAIGSDALEPQRIQQPKPVEERIRAIMLRLPRDAKLQIDDIDCQVVIQSEQRRLTLTTKQLLVTADVNVDKLIECTKTKGLLLPGISCLFKLTDVQMTNMQSLKLLSISDTSVSLQLRETGVYSDLVLRHCHVHYLDDEMTFWLATIQEQIKLQKAKQNTLFPTRTPANVQSKPSKQTVTSSLFQELILPFDLTLDLSDMSTHMTWPNVPDCAVSIVTLKTGTRITTDAGSTPKKPLRYIRANMQGDHIICQVGDTVRTPNGVTSPSRHIWGTPLAVNIIKLKVNFTPYSIEVEGSVNSLQVESCLELHSVVEHVLKVTLGWKAKGQDMERQKVTVEAGLGPKQQTHRVNVRLTDFNAFLCSDVKEFIMLRVDDVDVDSESDGDSTVVVMGTKLLGVTKDSKVIDCVEYKSLPEAILDVTLINLKYTSASKTLNAVIEETCCAHWNTTSHMTMYHHVKEVVLFGLKVKGLLPKRERVILSPEAQKMRAAAGTSKDLCICLNVKLVEFFYHVSPSKLNVISVKEFYATKQGSSLLKATSPECIIGFEGHPVFVIKSACIEKLVNSQQLLEDRKSFDSLTTPTNRAWGVYGKSVNMEFPYSYDFASNYDEIINLIKWLKSLHMHKKDRSIEEPLYADVLVRVQTFVLKLHDDPFEVKLGDNYQLMKDERLESERRRELMDNKVAELRQTHGELLSGRKTKRVEELYISLERKNMDIYIKRSQRLYSNSPGPQALLTLTLTGAEISALADPSMNGTTNIVRLMREIDSASPYPVDGLEFTTLFCRLVRGHAKMLDLQLRGYPQSIWKISDWHFWGRLIGAEQAGTPRAKRESIVKVGEPWGDAKVTRSMPPLKFFHDMATDATEMHIAWGPCIEPAWAQVGLAMDMLNKASVDPSQPMPFWDKTRLLLHGRLIASVQKCNLLWLSTRDPYVSTEQLDMEWQNIYMDWTNAHFLVKGDLDVYVRTASKYDDVRFMHLPNFRLEIGIAWLCFGDPDDHHSVLPCAPDKVPDHSRNEKHDSYAAFRSQNLNMNISLDIKGYEQEGEEPDIAGALFYSTTMRWLQMFQAISFVGATRPTRRGKLFNNTRPRKPTLGRHYKNIDFKASFPTVTLNYWASVARQRGIEMCLGQGSLGFRYNLQLNDVPDGLIHRPNADWSIAEMNAEIGESHAYLYTSQTDEQARVHLVLNSMAEKHHVASVSRVMYCRQQSRTTNLEDLSCTPSDDEDIMEEERDNTANEERDFIHKLVVHELRVSWTRFNRDAVLGLYDTYNKSQMLKNNLSTEALKGVKVESTATTRLQQNVATPTPNPLASANTPSPMSKLQTGHGATMLHQLLSETNTKFIVFSEETSGSSDKLQGVKACTTKDVTMKNWLIELENSQVMLKGCEASGYVIVCASSAQVMHCSHLPAWREGHLTNKTSWVGKLDGLQYFATVETPSSSSKDDVQWLPVSIIEPSPQRVTDVPDMVGSGESVGGVVSDTVGASLEDVDQESVQLQRIASRCSCQFYYASYGGEVSRSVAAEMLKSDSGQDEESDGVFSKEEAVNSMTLMYHDLQMCTNSAQYAMILDIINNLLLYVEPKVKEAMARMQHMRFALELSSIDDQKEPIMQLQNSLRNLVLQLRQLEKDLYLAQRALEESPSDQSMLGQIADIELQVNECKESLANASEDLRIMISCFKEIQLQRAVKRKLQTSQGPQVSRRVEVCFGSAKWRLTEEDGQLGMADVELRQFKYTRTTKNDDSSENLAELGWVTINNLLANDVYKDVLRPQDTSGKTKQVALRVIARGKPPVGGISVQENFELSVVPLTIQLTYKFFKKMMGFFFPGRNVDQESIPEEQGKGGGDDELDGLGSFSRTGSIRSTSSEESITSPRDSFKGKKKGGTFQKLRESTIIDKMKERARNNMFYIIKIPSVPLCVSYKGEKEKNIEDVHNFHLVLPSLEYHNCTWTWLDLLMVLKKEYKQALVSQAIKEKLRFKIGHKEEGPSSSDAREDVDKAKLLMGAKVTNIATEEKSSSKRALFGKGQSNH
ncbi:protein KIAA0100-like isoform X3 [Acanthaster planci]|uniref:Protein KIAA0100-like isoform X3 n=1 Tax=Acanthaster planci TaxID=133434 RepID=A0A8B7Z8H2_ACAPL|nr:protein KIAA0100-like isoform X3 [Acanthaster planci]